MKHYTMLARYDTRVMPNVTKKKKKQSKRSEKYLCPDVFFLFILSYIVLVIFPNCGLAKRSVVLGPLKKPLHAKDVDPF